jgi:SOS regulatory protein LexA
MATAARERGWERVTIEVGGAASVPLLGTVAAGLPFQAFPVEGVLDLPPGMWNGRRIFALRVRGASMVDEGIRDGDYLIVEPRETADSGQTVIAEVDGGVTVKRLFREKDGRLRLQPANPEMLPLVVGADRVRIVGAVVGVLRRHGFRPPAASRPRPKPVASDARTLDLTLRVIEQSVSEAEALAATRSGLGGARLRELARGLRSLRDCYLGTTTPRLREALLREAGEIVRRLRRFGAERR